MVGSVRECSGRFGRVRSTVSWRSVVSVCVRECLGWFGRVVQSVSVQECSGRLGRLSGSPRAGSVAAEGRARSGAPDAEIYASPRTNHGSCHPMVLDVGDHHPSEEASPAVRPVRRSGVTRLAVPGELPFQCCGPSLYLVHTWWGTAARAAWRKRGKL